MTSQEILDQLRLEHAQWSALKGIPGWLKTVRARELTKLDDDIQIMEIIADAKKEPGP